MKKKYFLYYGKYSDTYRIASAEDLPTVAALLSEGWTRTTRIEVRALRRSGCVVAKTATAYIDSDGSLVVVDPD